MSNVAEVIERILELPVNRLGVIGQLLDVLEEGDSSLDSSMIRRLSDWKTQISATPLFDIHKTYNRVLNLSDWAHAPAHRISKHGTYIVTAATLDKHHRFTDVERLDLLHTALISIVKECGWHLEAWAVFSNHYHFVGYSEEHSIKLNEFINRLHTETATDLNELDGEPERKLWHNYRDTRLTYQASYLTRLNYVRQK